MWRCRAILILALSYGYIAHANVGVEKRLPNLKLLTPILDKVTSLREEEFSKEHINDHFKPSIKRIPSSHYALIQNYVHQFKRYSHLQLSDQFAITVGTLRAEPLGEVKREIIDIPDVFSPQMDRIESGSEKGYGIKFKFEL